VASDAEQDPEYLRSRRGGMTAMRRIVAGVDGSEYSLRALRWAVVEAGRHGAELLALTTWTALPPPIASPHVDVNKAVDRQDGASAAEQALQTVVANAIAGNPPIVVEIVATEGHPAKLLAEQSRHADLVVVGARGRGGIAGWLLGSVSKNCSDTRSVPRQSFDHRTRTRSPRLKRSLGVSGPTLWWVSMVRITASRRCDGPLERPRRTTPS
jgi:nucleotide-binding universal stress UspA family protein